VFNQSEKQVIVTELPSRVGDSMKEQGERPAPSFQASSLERRPASDYPKVKVDSAAVKKSIRDLKFE